MKSFLFARDSANFIPAITAFIYDESNSFIHFAANGTKAFL